MRYPSERIACETARDAGTERTGLVDAAHRTACTARLDDPFGHGRYREISDDADDEKYDVDSRPLLRDISIVSLS